MSARPSRSCYPPTASFFQAPGRRQFLRKPNGKGTEHDMTGLAKMDTRLRQIADHLMALGDCAAFKPASIGTKLLPHLFILDIERDAAKGIPSLRIRLVG